jgi:hypothetical protein
MADRYSLGFDILKRRQPFSKASDGSNLIKLVDVYKGELQTLVSSLNASYDGLLINTSSADLLDKHGVTLNLPRNEGENDAVYRDRLLTDFRAILNGLTIEDLKDIIEDYTLAYTILERCTRKWLWSTFLTPGQAQFGFSDVGLQYSTLTGNAKVACRFQIPEDGAVNKVFAHMSATTPATVYAAVYADNAGVPNNKIADATATVVVSASGWYEFTFSQERLDKDAYYWLCVNAASTCKVTYDAGITHQAAGRVDTPPPDDPFGSVQVWNSYKCSMYADYTPIQNPNYPQNWEKPLNEQASRFIAIVAQDVDLTEQQLDDIEEAVIQIKPAHIVIQIAKDEGTYWQLLREIK